MPQSDFPTTVRALSPVLAGDVVDELLVPQHVVPFKDKPTLFAALR
jgi:hypothetical protein